MVNVRRSCQFSNLGELIYTLPSSGEELQVPCILTSTWSVGTHFAETASEAQREALLPPGQ